MDSSNSHSSTASGLLLLLIQLLILLCLPYTYQPIRLSSRVIHPLCHQVIKSRFVKTGRERTPTYTEVLKPEIGEVDSTELSSTAATEISFG